MPITSNNVKECLTIYFIGVLFIHALDLARLCEKGLIMKNRYFTNGAFVLMLACYLVPAFVAYVLIVLF